MKVLGRPPCRGPHTCRCSTMPPQAPWSPTAQAFAHHQFSHVVNFWKQGRQADFRLKVLPGGQAELNLTFRLPSASQVIPPPSHVPQVLTPGGSLCTLFTNIHSVHNFVHYLYTIEAVHYWIYCWIRGKKTTDIGSKRASSAP